MKTDATPKCYSTRRTNADGKMVYAVIFEGNPVCRDMNTEAEAIAAAAHMKACPTATWDGDKGEFIA